jgi:hypothetical protein
MSYPISPDWMRTFIFWDAPTKGEIRKSVANGGERAAVKLKFPNQPPKIPKSLTIKMVGLMVWQIATPAHTN